MRALFKFAGGREKAAPLAMSRAILSFCRRVKGGLPGLGLQNDNNNQTHRLALLRLALLRLALLRLALLRLALLRSPRDLSHRNTPSLSKLHKFSTPFGCNGRCNRKWECKVAYLWSSWKREPFGAHWVMMDRLGGCVQAPCNGSRRAAGEG